MAQSGTVSWDEEEVIKNVGANTFEGIVALLLVIGRVRR